MNQLNQNRMNIETNGTQEIYNVGDICMIDNPNINQPKVFTTHKVDNDWGVVYYYQLNGIEETIGISYITKLNL